MGAPVNGAVTVRAPAKINLQLSVGGQRPDGFHDLVSVFQTVSRYDEIVADDAPGQPPSVTVEGAEADDVPADESNLAVRAAVVLADATGVSPEVALHIRKGIPVAGGMAGGSADAAGALVACDALWGTGLTREAMLEIAAEVGSDVPFAVLGGVAVGTGRGEQLTPALARGTLHWVLAFHEGGLSTPAVYAELDRLRDAGELGPGELTPSEQLLAALAVGDPRSAATALRNDMQPAAVSLRPSLQRTLDAGEECGALAGLVSGSGPTCAFLTRDAEHALDLAVALSATGVCSSLARVHGPVPGARSVAQPARTPGTPGTPETPEAR